MSTRLTDVTITTARLISFSDGVFAIAVTLLVFNLKVPAIPVADAHRLLPGLISAMIPHFVTYILTFLLVAVYWVFHHRVLNMVTHIDSPFIWMNIWYLLSISFIPFPSALIAAYPREISSFIFYVSSMISVGIISMIMVGYAAYNRRLIGKDMPLAIVKYYFFRQSTSFFVFLTAIPLAFYELRWAQYYLFVTFPLHWITRKYFRKQAKAGD